MCRLIAPLGLSRCRSLPGSRGIFPPLFIHYLSTSRSRIEIREIVKSKTAMRPLSEPGRPRIAIPLSHPPALEEDSEVIRIPVDDGGHCDIFRKTFSKVNHAPVRKFT